MKQLFIFLFVFLSFHIYTQEMILDWTGCYGSVGGNMPQGVAILPNGNTIMSMNVRGENAAFNNYHGGYDIWLVILNHDGFIINNKCFGGSDYDSSVDIEIGEDFIYIIGYSKSTDGDALSEPIGNPLADLWIIKTDFDLNIIWEKKYGPLGPCWLASSDLTANEGLVVITDFFNQGGGDVSQYYGGTDIWTFEIDSEGEMLWEKTLGNAYENTAGNILSTDHNTTIILGETSHSGAMVDCDCHSTDGLTRDIWLVELNNQGEIIWQDCYGGSNWELGLDILQEDNGYTMFVISESNDYDVSGNHGNGETSDYWMAHINQSGVMEWQNCFGGSDDENAKQFYKTEDNGYVLIGSTASNDGDVSFNHGPGVGDVWVVVLDSNRNILWEHSYGGAQHNYPLRNSIAQRGEMDFVIAATIQNHVEWEGGDIDCIPYPVNTDEGSVWIFRIYDPTIGASTLDNDYNGLSVYPNPATAHLFIDLPEHHNKVEIEIINVFGNTIKQLTAISEQTQIKWNCQDVASGVYFYQAEIGGVVYRGRLVIN